MNRARAAALGRQTLEIIDAGEFVLDGRPVLLRPEIEAAVAGTVGYPPDSAISWKPRQWPRTAFQVSNETTLSAARRLVHAGHAPVALNFASAKNPGGGFLSGARAQEESLARSSALYACLKDAPMYAFHRERRDPTYTRYCIYSPAVPVFRDDEGELVEPFNCAFITSPAVNAKVVLERDPSREHEVYEEMARRVKRVLSVAIAHNHDTLILGAWGCGVFGNDPKVVSRLFKDALVGAFDRVFRSIVFAIVDWSDEKRFIGPFEETFGHAIAQREREAGTALGSDRSPIDQDSNHSPRESTRDGSG
jgi:uncharacterized protein (TIGR02452 family)